MDPPKIFRGITELRNRSPSVHRPPRVDQYTHLRRDLQRSPAINFTALVSGVIAAGASASRLRNDFRLSAVLQPWETFWPTGTRPQFFMRPSSEVSGQDNLLFKESCFVNLKLAQCKPILLVIRLLA
jgi:hypothetical protein